MSGPGSHSGGSSQFSNRKYVTDELLTKLTTLLEMMRKSQPPIDPTVSAINQESDQVQFWTDKLKENPSSPYARAQLMQALNEKQQLYDMYQGNVNPFKTSVPQTTVTPPTQTKMSDRDMLREMMRLKALYEKKEVAGSQRREQRRQQRRQKPSKTSEETPFEQERYFYTPPLPPEFQDVKPPVVTGITKWDTPKGPRTRSQGPLTPVQLARKKLSEKIKKL